MIIYLWLKVLDHVALERKITLRIARALKIDSMMGMISLGRAKMKRTIIIRYHFLNNLHNYANHNRMRNMKNLILTIITRIHLVLRIAKEFINFKKSLVNLPRSKKKMK
jgi:hypothetical protein